MQLDSNPPIDEKVERALLEALAAAQQAALRRPQSAWRKAALDEAVERDEVYAFSPRSTRGATRA